MKKISYEQAENYIPHNDFPTDKQISGIIDSPPVENLMEKNLTEKQRLYITLYYKKGMSMKKIAETQGVNISTVSRTVDRARQRIFSGMEKECFRRLLGGEKQ